MLRVTVTPYGPFSIGDFVGNEPYQLDRQFVSMTFSAGDGPTDFYCTQQQYDSGIRKALEKASGLRVKIAGTRKNKPLMVYSVVESPEEVPRLHQVEDGALSLTGGTQTVTLRGENLIAGRKAVASIGAGTGLLTLTSTRKGPIGERITVNLLKAGSAGIEIVRGEDDSGQATVTLNVTPATGSANANAIAAQFTGNAAKYVTAAGGGSGNVLPANGIKLSLSGLHAGAGVAYLDMPSVLARTVLRVEALRPGSGYNGWSIKVLAASGGGTVVVNASAQTILLTPATGSGNTDASVLRDQLNASSGFAAQFVASVIGTSGDDMPVSDWSFLYGGCDNIPSAQIGGVTADVIAYDDTSAQLRVAGSALATGGCAAGEVALVNLILGDRCLSAPVDITA